MGKLDSAASITYARLLRQPLLHALSRDFNEGETYLGSAQVTTDASGHKEFDVTLPVETVAARGSRSPPRTRSATPPSSRSGSSSR